MQTKGY